MDQNILSAVNNILQKRAYLMQQLEILRRESDKIRRESDRIRAELNSVNSTIQVLHQIGLPKGVLPDETPPRTVADMALELLYQAHPQPLKALDILTKIQELWEPGLARTSLSPPLSRLKHRKWVDVRDNYWSLTHDGLEHMKKIKSGAESA